MKTEKYSSLSEGMFRASLLFFSSLSHTIFHILNSPFLARTQRDLDVRFPSFLHNKESRFNH